MRIHPRSVPSTPSLDPEFKHGSIRETQMRKSIILLSAIATIATTVFAQDPADGWMAYAVGSIPDSYERITRLEMFVSSVTIIHVFARSFELFFFTLEIDRHINIDHAGHGSSTRNPNTDSSRSSLLGSVWILRII